MARILAFDIGASALKVVQWDGNKASKMVSVDMPDNLVKGGVIVSYEAMSEFIKETVKENKFSCKEVAVILPVSMAFIRRISMPYMTPAQVKINLPYEFKDFLTTDKEQYCFDYTLNETINDEEGNPSTLDITAATVSKDIINAYTLMFLRAGLKLKYAIPYEIALLNLMKKITPADVSESAIIDLGHTQTRVSIVKDGVIETNRVIEYGLEALDDIVSDGFGVDKHLARSYKQSNYNNLFESEGAQTVFNNIALDIRKTFNFYKYNNSESTLSSAWICGGGHNIPHLKKAITDNLTDMKTDDLASLLYTIAGTQEDTPTFALDIGLALQPAKDALNLKISNKKGYKLWQLVLGLVVILVAAVCVAKFGVIDPMNKVQAAESEVANLTTQNVALQQHIADYAEVESDYAKYSNGWMTDEEKALVKRSEILDLLEDELLPNCTVVSTSINGNTLSVQFSGMTLKEASGLVSKISARDDVDSINVYNAQADSESGEEIDAKTGKTISKALINMDITMVIVNDGGEN